MEMLGFHHPIITITGFNGFAFAEFHGLSEWGFNRCSMALKNFQQLQWYQPCFNGLVLLGEIDTGTLMFFGSK